MSLFRRNAPSLSQSRQPMPRVTRELVNGLGAGMVRYQPLRQLPSPQIAIIRIFRDVHGDAFPRIGGITL